MKLALLMLFILGLKSRIDGSILSFFLRRNHPQVDFNDCIFWYSLCISVTSLFGGYYSYSPVKTDKRKAKPPFNLEIMYGIKNVAITRKFANFVIYSKVGKVHNMYLIKAEPVKLSVFCSAF